MGELYVAAILTFRRCNSSSMGKGKRLALLMGQISKQVDSATGTIHPYTTLTAVRVGMAETRTVSSSTPRRWDSIQKGQQAESRSAKDQVRYLASFSTKSQCDAGPDFGPTLFKTSTPHTLFYRVRPRNLDREPLTSWRRLGDPRPWGGVGINRPSQRQYDRRNQPEWPHRCERQCL